jgi:hypothetical protein
MIGCNSGRVGLIDLVLWPLCFEDNAEIVLSEFFRVQCSHIERWDGKNDVGAVETKWSGAAGGRADLFDLDLQTLVQHRICYVLASRLTGLCHLS